MSAYEMGIPFYIRLVLGSGKETVAWGHRGLLIWTQENVLNHW